MNIINDLLQNPWFGLAVTLITLLIVFLTIRKGS